MNLIDNVIVQCDGFLKTLLPPSNRPHQRTRPDKEINNAKPLSPQETKHMAGLMRVNHAGEVCAQALYLGQAFTAKCENTKAQMAEAAEEEVDHLAWCEARLEELHAKTSRLNPIWYIGSWLIGATTGLISDKVSLGFVRETERQVGLHLQHHLNISTQHDEKSKQIIQQMWKDEKAHEQQAEQAGGIAFPAPIRLLMNQTSRLLTKLSYVF